MSDEKPGGLKRRGGRKPKISRKLIKTILGKIAKGLPAKYACLCAGIVTGTYFRWLSEAEAEITAEMTPAEVSELTLKKELRDGLERAKAKAIDFHVQNINRAGKRGNWMASAWRLKLLDKDEFADKQITQLEIPANSNPIPIAITLSAMDERFAAALKRAYGK